MDEIVGKDYFRLGEKIGSEEISALKTFTFIWEINMSSEDIVGAIFRSFL